MNQYGGGAIIFGLEPSEQSGAVDILATLKWLHVTGWSAPGAARAVRDLPAGGKAETFSRSARGAVRQRRSPCVDTR
jgi:hypothetical protein